MLLFINDGAFMKLVSTFHSENNIWNNEVSCYELSSTFPLYGYLQGLTVRLTNRKP